MEPTCFTNVTAEAWVTDTPRGSRECHQLTPPMVSAFLWLIDRASAGIVFLWTAIFAPGVEVLGVQVIQLSKEIITVKG